MQLAAKQRHVLVFLDRDFCLWRMLFLLAGRLARRCGLESLVEGPESRTMMIGPETLWVLKMSCLRADLSVI